MPHHLRLVAPKGEEEFLTKWAKDHFLQAAIFFEDKARDGTKSQEHYHMYIGELIPNILEKTVRQNLVRKYPGVNRVSLKVQKGSIVENLAYTMKQGNQVCMIGIPETLVQAAKARNDEIQGNLKKVKKPNTIMADLLKEFAPREYCYTHQELVSGIVKYFHAKNKLQPDPYMIQKYVRTICASHNIERYARCVWDDYSGRPHGLQLFFSQDD